MAVRETYSDMEALALASPRMQLHMLDNWAPPMPPEEVLAIARVHAQFALLDAEAILNTAGKDATKMMAQFRGE
jgi:hypothetical protein